MVPAPPAHDSFRCCLRATLALVGAGLMACGARTQVNAPGPVVSVAPVATTDAAGAVDSGVGDGGADAATFDGGQGAAPLGAPAPAVTELHLPWSAGETWFLTSGPHSSKRSALDFAPPNLNPRTGQTYDDACSRKRGDAYWVRAAADGHFTAVLRAGCPCVQIEHADGTTTNYFHLRRSSVKKLGFKVGDPVQAGQALGHPSCEVGPKVCGTTHAPSGVHVHFHRSDAATGARLPADGMVISGWKVKALGRERDGMMTKGDEVRQTRGKLLGWACSPTTAACGGKRNDLEGDLAPVPGEEVRLVSLDAAKKPSARAPAGDGHIYSRHE
jgi:hypothetical protein